MLLEPTKGDHDCLFTTSNKSQYERWCCLLGTQNTCSVSMKDFEAKGGSFEPKCSRIGLGVRCHLGKQKVPKPTGPETSPSHHTTLPSLGSIDDVYIYTLYLSSTLLIVLAPLSLPSTIDLDSLDQLTLARTQSCPPFILVVFCQGLTWAVMYKPKRKRVKKWNTILFIPLVILSRSFGQ